MPESSLALTSLMAFAVLFGIKHGFDADHLASIDGLARLQSRHGRTRLARLCGLLFSGGHGVVVLGAAWMFAWYGIGRLPYWLDSLGIWISIIFLLSIGMINLRNAWQPKDAASAPRMSPMANWIMRLSVPHGVGGSLMVGALFALSLDAMTIAAWFGLAGSLHGGMSATLILGLCFVLGMVATDTVNGLVVASLIKRSEHFVQQAGRLFSLLVACSALIVAGFGAAKFYSEAVDSWADGKELMVGLMVLAIILIGYFAARSLNQVGTRKCVQVIEDGH
ncbi:nickel transporter [Herbaspirillum sp. RTI4]|uniref:HoxN/HupN/NixA family nickel/cobalt transporter n=1 Tax=Herbaspirillum sp. RTI4 TaxID=3048640 RepID=UPI002AB5935A|nr:nickel transporter [Herbaspirillum sp. RTI4]MDY7577069.1 nickel transporter [Herbaspirillum sp. RTI4]MEA9982249.1 nickel transporter [Herbaspirillum sp. RTI4]